MATMRMMSRQAGAALLEPPTTSRRGTVLAWVTIALVTIAIRYPLFGNPFFHVDEQFYLLVGDRMLHGAIPYVDIWDRKPIGLFLLYAAVRLLPGTGILAYQIASTAFVVATGWVLALIARRFAGALAATTGALLYVLLCQFMGGGGGQSPVFYNLPVAIAALLVLEVVQASDGRRLLREGALAMLLMGVAIQIKYTAAIEGVYLGCVLLWAGRRAGVRGMAMASRGLALALLGLAPTLLAAGWYAWMGRLPAFWYANFVSILQRGPLPPGMAAGFLAYDGMILAPVLPLLVVSFGVIGRTEHGPVRTSGMIVIGWLVAAIGGFLSIGTFFNHYALPILSPVAILCAIAASRTLVVPAYSALWAALYVAHFEPEALRRRDAGIALARSMVEASAPAAGHCMAVFTDQLALLLLTHACTQTAYLFPQHLITARERNALGADQFGELHKLILKRPGVIVTATRFGRGYSSAATAMLNTALSADYRAVLTIPASHPGAGEWPAFLFVRRDLWASAHDAHRRSR